MSKLLFLSHCYPAKQDDMRGNFFLPLISRLAIEGIEVDVLTPSWRKTSRTLTLQRGFNAESVWRFPWPGPRLAGVSLKDPRAIVYLMHFLWRWRCAVREIAKRHNGWNAVLAAWGIPAGMLLRVRPLNRLSSAIWWLGTDFNRFDTPRFAPMLRLVTASSCENWSNSHRVAAGLKRRTGINVRFVPLHTTPQTEHIDGYEMSGNQLPRVLSIGRLEPVKGFDIGIRAVLKLLSRGVQLEYRIVGDGPQRDELIKLANSEDNIRLLGYLDNARLNQELKKADIVLLPSRQEGMPLVFFEALVAGKPVIATDVGDIRKCLYKTSLGLVSRPCDVTALADNLQRALNGAVKFNVRHAKAILSAYSLDNTVAAVRTLISKQNAA